MKSNNTRISAQNLLTTAYNNNSQIRKYNNYMI